MMGEGRMYRFTLFLVAVVAGVACAPLPPDPTRGGSEGRVDRSAAPARPSRAVLAIGAETTNLASKLEPQRTYGGEYGWISNSPLVMKDERGAPQPLLAAELPSRDAGTWVVNADGTMATTWRIRPNAKWHDGQPVRAEDIAFAFRVYSHPLVPIREREPERFMDRVQPLDEKTFVIHWKQSYPWAHELNNRQLEALPEHIMGSVFDAGDVDAFLSHSFWTTPAYVGNGPYRLTQWDPGAQMIFRAFPDYFMGAPKIDELVLHIISDPNTLVANVLSGVVDVTLGTTLGQQQATIVRDQWATSGEGRVVSIRARLRYTQLQFDPARSQQPALQDVRVRRAIVHGIDRDTLARTVSDGASGVADVVMSPSDPLYARMEQAIVKYPYDPNRAAVLLQEAGWTRLGDTLVNAAGQPFALDVRNTSGRDGETELQVMAADLGRLGMQISQSVVPQSRISDVEYRVTFPGINVTAVPLDVPASMNVASGDQCATAERRYVGTNRGCWRNAEYDRLFTLASTALDPAERDDAAIRGLRIVTDEVGIFGLSHSIENAAVRAGLIGAGDHWPAQVGTPWNIHLWHWQERA